MFIFNRISIKSTQLFVVVFVVYPQHVLLNLNLVVWFTLVFNNDPSHIRYTLFHNFWAFDVSALFSFTLGCEILQTVLCPPHCKQLISKLSNFASNRFNVLFIFIISILCINISEIRSLKISPSMTVSSLILKPLFAITIDIERSTNILL